MMSTSKTADSEEYLDNILDSISKYGIESIPASEKIYLNNYHSWDNGISKMILDKFNERIVYYRKLYLYDTEILEDSIFNNYISDFDKRELRYSLLWEHLENDDAYILIKRYSLNTYSMDFEYERLTDEVKNIFKRYMNDRYDIG